MRVVQPNPLNVGYMLQINSASRCCCIGYRRGRTQPGCEHAVGVGNDLGRWPEQATCVRMAGVEGVTRAQRAAGMP
jgi:hypothetical protein